MVKNKEDKIHVAFCIDKNYYIFVLIILKSIFINNKSNSKYKIYILENELSKIQKLHMEIYVKLKGHEVVFLHVDTSVIDGGKDLYKNFKSHIKYISRIGMSRFLLADLLPDLNKIIYLDSDLLVQADLKELWDIDLGDNYAAMACQYLSTNRFMYTLKFDNYFNIGVMLINLDLFRRDNIKEKIRDFLQKNETTYPDQDAANLVMKGRIKELSYLWNFWIYRIDSYISPKEFKEAKIIHYPAHKPWNNMFDGDYHRSLFLKLWGKSYLSIFKLKYIVPSLKTLIKGKN